MKKVIQLETKIKCKSVGIDNIKLRDNKIHEYRELFNDQGYKIGEIESNILSITIPMLYSNHNGNNLKLKNNATQIIADIKKALSKVGIDDFDLENCYSQSIEINCNFDTKKINPSSIVTYIAKVLEYYNSDNNNRTNRACHTIKPDLNHPMSNNYSITDSVLHRESNFSFKVYNKTKQLKDTKNIYLDQNILRIEIKFKGSYLKESSVEEGIQGILEKFEKLSQLYMKHTKSKLIDKLIKFQNELEKEIIKELQEGKGLTKIYKSYKYYILDSKTIENALCSYLESIGVKEARKVAQNRVKELKKTHKELKEFTGTQKVVDDIVKYFS